MIKTIRMLIYFKVLGKGEYNLDYISQYYVKQIN